MAPVSRRNGKRSIEIDPAVILAWTPGTRTPLSSMASLMVLGWIYRRMTVLKMATKGVMPDVVLEDDVAFVSLRKFIVRLAGPNHDAEILRFAKSEMGFCSIAEPMKIPVRIPRADVFEWARHLWGLQLKEGPNSCHPMAKWLRGAVVRLNQKGTLWQIRVRYSYRHDDGWAIGIDQMKGETIEAFDDRAWAWIRDLIAWRHDEKFYSGFFISADGMKKNELRNCAQVELKMHDRKSALCGVFGWGTGAPGNWESEIAEALVHDMSTQFRELKNLKMTSARLRTFKKWLREDRRLWVTGNS